MILFFSMSLDGTKNIKPKWAIPTVPKLRPKHYVRQPESKAC